jgi:hypothetical protein
MSRALFNSRYAWMIEGVKKSAVNRSITRSVTVTFLKMEASTFQILGPEEKAREFQLTV